MKTKVSTEKPIAKSGANPASADSLKNLLMRMDERWSRIPETERDRIPTDGAMNLDHYLYGSAKVSK